MVDQTFSFSTWQLMEEKKANTWRAGSVCEEEEEVFSLPQCWVDHTSSPESTFSYLI